MFPLARAVPSSEPSRLPPARPWRTWLAGAMLAAASWACGAQPAAEPEAPPARVIVKLRSSSTLMQAQQAGRSTAAAVPAPGQRMRALGRRLGVEMEDGPRLADRIHVATARGLSSAQLARRLAAQGDVEFAVEDQRRRIAAVPPNDPQYAAGQWYLKAPAGGDVAAVNAPPAWQITPGLTRVVVAVLDTGVRYDHPDLKHKLLPGYDMISNPWIANDDTGRDDNASDVGDSLSQAEIDGNRVVFGGCDVENTSSWHGTNVAGILGAQTDNGVGIAGLGWNVRILPVRVLGKCGGYDSDIIAGMRWAAGLAVDGLPLNPNPARIINLSLGGEGACNDAYRNVLSELAARQVTVVASAGNSNGGAVSLPANCAPSSPNVIGVGALRHTGEKVGYSALGSEITISAPGGNSEGGHYILATSNSGTTTAVPDAQGGSTYVAGFGTSYVAPQVSAAAALMLSVNPRLTPAEIRSKLVASARAFPSSGSSACSAPGAAAAPCLCNTAAPFNCGAGMLDVGAAVSASVAIDASPALPAISQAMTLQPLAANFIPTGDTVTSGQAWSVTEGGGTLASAAPATSVTYTLTPASAGTFTVRLALNTQDGSATPQVRIAERSFETDPTLLVPYGAAAESPTQRRDSGGGGGGGSLDGIWLAGLALATAVAARVRRPTRRAPGQMAG